MSSFKLPMILAAAGLTAYVLASPKHPLNRLIGTAGAVTIAYFATRKDEEETTDSVGPLFIHTPIPDEATRNAIRDELMEPTPKVRSPDITNIKEIAPSGPVSEPVPEPLPDTEEVVEAEPLMLPPPAFQEQDYTVTFEFEGAKAWAVVFFAIYLLLLFIFTVYGSLFL